MQREQKENNNRFGYNKQKIKRNFVHFVNFFFFKNMLE